MKRIIAACAALGLILCGCAPIYTPPERDHPLYDRDGDKMQVRELIDPTTGCKYLHTPEGGGGLSPLIGEDGKPVCSQGDRR